MSFNDAIIEICEAFDLEPEYSVMENRVSTTEQWNRKVCEIVNQAIADLVSLERKITIRDEVK